MRLSLRVQLSLAIVVVITAVVAAQVLLAARTTLDEVYRFSEAPDTAVVTAAARRFEAARPDGSNVGMRDVDSLLAAIPRAPGVEYLWLSGIGVLAGASRAEWHSASLVGQRLDGEQEGYAGGFLVDSQPGSVSGQRPMVLRYREPATGSRVTLIFDRVSWARMHRADGRQLGTLLGVRFRLPPPEVRAHQGRVAQRQRWQLFRRGLTRTSGGSTLSPDDDPQAIANRILANRLLLGAVFAVLLMFAAASRMTAPLRALTGATRRLAQGDRSARVPVKGPSEVADLAQAFNAMADSLERSEAARRHMVSDVAHELRTPLTNLRVQLEALQDGLVTADPERLAALHGETLLLARLVDDLQTLSLADAGALSVQVTVFDLREVLARAVAAHATRAEAAGVALELVPGAAVRVRGDAERLAQVVRNLLANALDHTPPGGRITLAAEPQPGGGARLSVRDTGAGIAPEHLPHVFDRFWRADPSRSRPGGGAGLGLAIVKELVRLHGGEVGVHSAPGAGTTFEVRLPAAS